MRDFGRLVCRPSQIANRSLSSHGMDGEKEGEIRLSEEAIVLKTDDYF